MIAKPTSKHWPKVPNEHWGRAQEMRAESTHAEHVLWQILRARKLGVTFRRQHPIGPYIADFFCAELNLVIEVDGDVHDEAEQIAHDQAREEYLRTRSLRIVRFRNEQVLEQLDTVVQEIERIIEERRRR